MKKLLLSIFVLSAIISNSQVIIDDVDFATAGDTVIYSTDSSFSDDLNNLTLVGDSIIWDFTNLNTVTDDTILFVNPNNILSGTYFGSSSFGYEDLVANRFMSVNSNEVKTDGISIPITSLIDSTMLQDTTLFDSALVASIPENAVFRYINGGLFYLNLPSQFGDLDNGTVEGVFTFYYGDSLMGFPADSIRIREIVDYESEIDNYGILQLPAGDFYANKQTVKYNRSFTIDVATVLPFVGAFWINDIFSIPLSINEVTYRFHAKGQLFPLLEINTDSAGTFSRSMFQAAPTSLTVSAVDSLNNLSLYNNIDVDFYSINMIDNGIEIISDKIISEIIITNEIGQVITVEKTNDRKFTQALNSHGIYFVKVIAIDGTIKSKKIIW